MAKISVCTVAYNHEAYIAQAIESVLMQCGPDLEIEMVIGEDVSKDNTRSIIADYARRYPDIIKPIFHEKNVGPGPNSRACLDACTGEFIAALEGDDYWTDPNKLRLQVAALRAQPDCAMCFHDAEAFNATDGSEAWTFSGRFSHILPPVGSPLQTYTQVDLARWGWFIPTASMLFRANSLPKPMPQWLEGVHSGDFTLQLLSTRHGSALYLPQVMSRYRLHSRSITATTSETLYQFERHIYAGNMYQQHVFDPKYRKHADIYLAQQYQNYADYLGSQGLWRQQLIYLAKALFLNRQRIPLYVKRRISEWLKYNK